MKSKLIANSLIIVLVVVVLIGAYWFVNRGDAESSTIHIDGAAQMPSVGAAAPQFSAEDILGTSISTAELQGRPVWLVVMATWCQGCRSEVPDIEDSYRQANGNIEVVAIYSGESDQQVKEYVDRMDLSYRHIADPDKAISAAYGIGAVPTHFFIDSSGTVRYTRVGVMSPELISQALSSIS